MARPSQLIIDLAALRHNYAIAASLSEQGQCLPVIKANGYGHGAVAIAKALQPMAPAFAVACTEEATELREAGIVKPILLLEGAFNNDEILNAAKSDYWLMVIDSAQADAICHARLPTPVKAWLKVDTGMHRLGVTPEQAIKIYQQLSASNNVQPGIIFSTHLASADELDSDYSQQQIDQLLQLNQSINATVSIANSPGLLAWPEARAGWTRPGYMLYGHTPFAVAQPQADQLQPVMTFKSAITALRDVAVGESVGYGGSWVAGRPSRIATVTVGYGDGYPRSAVNGTPVIVAGKRAKLAGRVSMDMITVDVTDLPLVKIGDEVILWGAQLAATEVAQWAATIAYELVARMPARCPRIYINAEG